MKNMVNEKANTLLVKAKTANLMVAAAESCTGGLVCAAITDLPGSSEIFDRGFVTYSNDAKCALLGVDPAILAAHGAVSGETARAMAQGALDHSRADVAVAITGIAGPGGGSVEKPIGLVHFACARRGRPTVHVARRFGPLSRAAIREAAVAQALDLLIAAVDA